MVGQTNQAAAVNSSMANSSVLLGTSMSGNNLNEVGKQGDLGKELRGPGEENEVPGKPLNVDVCIDSEEKRHAANSTQVRH